MSNSTDKDITDRFDGKRVLVVEDEVSLRFYFSEVIGDTGCVVDVAENGVRGLAKYNQNRYDLIFTDLKMPYMDGFEMMQRIRMSGNGVPVILVSSLPLFEHEWKAGGFADYRKKPLLHDDVMKCLRRYLGKE